MYKLAPDFVYRPSADLREMVAYRAVPAKVSGALETLALDATIRTIRFSLKEVFIIDNRDPGKGDIYLVSVVTDNVSAEPISLRIKTFEDIHDGEPLQIGPGGLVTYRNEEGKIPGYLDYRILVMESDQEIRDAGDLLEEIRQDATFKSFRDALLTVTGASLPIVALATAAGDFVLGLVARILKMNRDDQLIYIVGGFDDAFDDLGVKYGLVTHKNSYAKVTYQVEAA